MVSFARERRRGERFEMEREWREREDAFWYRIPLNKLDSGRVGTQVLITN